MPDQRLRQTDHALDDIAGRHELAEQLVNGWKHGFEGPEDMDNVVVDTPGAQEVAK